MRPTSDRCWTPSYRPCEYARATTAGGAITRYTIPYSKDVNQEIWYSLRYRQYYSYFQTSYPDLANLPLLLTEGGGGWSDRPGGPGWKVADAVKYIDWLTWFDARMKEEPLRRRLHVVSVRRPQLVLVRCRGDLPLAGPAHPLQRPADAPATPANLNAAINSPTSVQLTWGTASGRPATTPTIDRQRRALLDARDILDSELPPTTT